MKLYSPSVGRYIEVVGLESEVKTKPPARARKAANAFVQLHLETLARACAAANHRGIFVWAWINYEAWRTNSATVAITNEALSVYGIHRNVKRRAIAAFKKAGLITVRQTGKQAIVVTLTAWPNK